MRSIFFLLSLFGFCLAHADGQFSTGNDFEIREASGKVTVVCEPYGVKKFAVKHDCHTRILYPKPTAKIVGIDAIDAKDADQIKVQILREGWEGSTPPVIKEHFGYYVGAEDSFDPASGSSINAFDLFGTDKSLLHPGSNTVLWELKKGEQSIKSGFFYVKVAENFKMTCNPMMTYISHVNDCQDKKTVCANYFRSAGGTCSGKYPY